MLIQPGAVKLVLWCHGMHVTQVHPVTAEDQFHCTRLYSVGRKGFLGRAEFPSTSRISRSFDQCRKNAKKKKTGRIDQSLPQIYAFRVFNHACTSSSSIGFSFSAYCESVETEMISKACLQWSFEHVLFVCRWSPTACQSLTFLQDSSALSMLIDLQVVASWCHRDLSQAAVKVKHRKKTAGGGGGGGARPPFTKSSIGS